jgi:hypothetical protein
MSVSNRFDAVTLIDLTGLFMGPQIEISVGNFVKIYLNTFSKTYFCNSYTSGHKRDLSENL